MTRVVQNILVSFTLILGTFAFTQPVWACETHDDCDISQKCDESGACVALSDGDCRQKADCPDTANQYCDTRTVTCRYYCNSDNQCIQDDDAGIFEYCDMDTKQCEPLGTDGDSDLDSESGFCLDDWECDVSEYCDLDLHRCLPRCYSDDDCPEGQVCMLQHCAAIDGDEDNPWEYPDEDWWVGDEDVFEIPADYDFPSEDGDLDAAGGDTTGGLSGCPAGEVCVEDGDDEGSANQDDGGGCHQAPIGAGLLLFTSLLLVALHRRRGVTANRTQ